MESLSFDKIQTARRRFPTFQTQATTGIVKTPTEFVMLSANQQYELKPRRNCHREQTTGNGQPFPPLNPRHKQQSHATEHRRRCEPAQPERTQ